ncbi:hypothetical protein C8Q70DRAFT_945375 [Cubamyces menziesii]|nr:hypothetical protein C8Q70DRAFT_945375 [Cubamyces menziesii]
MTDSSCSRTYPTLPEDVLILIAQQLKRYDLEGLREMSCASRQVRSLCLPILFEHVRMIYSSRRGSPYPPEAARPYVKRLSCPVVHKTPPEEFYRTYLRVLPNLSHVQFEGMPGGMTSTLMDICLENVTSLDMAYEARWTVASSAAHMFPYTVNNPLVRFSLASHCFRELVSYMDGIDLDDEYALESRLLARLVCDMHATAESLSLPMETAPWSHMVELPWPRIQSFALYGRYSSLNQASVLSTLLSRMSTLHTLRIQAAQLSHLSRTPLLGLSASSAAPGFPQLRSLTVAYPNLNPDDAIFSLKTPHLTRLSLRDEPRYYLYLRNKNLVMSSFAAPILKASECLAILRKKGAPLLSSLEVVYEVDAGEDELLQYISSAYLYLARLEVHRYRGGNDSYDPFISLATTFANITSLKTLHLNIDCDQIPPINCHSDEKYSSWSKFIYNQAQEVLSIMQTCPRFEYVAFLDPRRQFATWIEYRPAWYPGERVDMDVIGTQRPDCDWSPYVPLRG